MNRFGIGRRHRPLNKPQKSPKRVLIWVSIIYEDEYEPDLEEPKPNVPGRLEVVPVNTSSYSSYSPFGDDVAEILGMDDPVSSPEAKRESTATEPEPPAEKVRYTRGCHAPGIRHSASCKKAFEASSSPSVETCQTGPRGNVAMEGSTEGLAVDTEFARVTRLGLCPSPLPFGGSTVLSLTRGPAGNRTTTGSLSATQDKGVAAIPRTRVTRWKRKSESEQTLPELEKESG